jgi:hypothetical protein
MVKQSAISNPQAIVDAYSDKGGIQKSSCISAIKKKLSKSTQQKTAVLWTDTGEPILTLAVGQNQ